MFKISQQYRSSRNERQGDIPYDIVNENLFVTVMFHKTCTDDIVTTVLRYVGKRIGII